MGARGETSRSSHSARPDYGRPRRWTSRFRPPAFARIEHRPANAPRSVDVVADADEQRLMQAVVQLAANAVRYSDEGSGIRFGVDRVLGPEGPEIHVTVRDEGIGIGPEDQRRIFERFTRVDGSRGSGTGLGLPIVLAIAEGHDGVVRLLSTPGGGSTFTIVFPQFARRAPEDPPPPAGDTDRRGRGPEDDTTTASRRDQG